MKQILTKKDDTKLTSWANACKVCGDLKSLDQYYIIDKKSMRRNTVCKACVNAKEKAKRECDFELIQKFTLVTKLIDYEKSKNCKKCGVFKEADSFPKNGRRRKNKCKQCVSEETAAKNAYKTYSSITEPFNCRTCNVKIEVQDIYIENKRNNKPCTQCKDCYFSEVNHRKSKRRALIKNSKQMNTSEEETRIKEIYRQCRQLSKSTGIEYQVDHIKPLSKGGAHHPDNLQILTAEENRKKADKYETNIN